MVRFLKRYVIIDNYNCEPDMPAGEGKICGRKSLKNSV